MDVRSNGLELVFDTDPNAAAMVRGALAREFGCLDERVADDAELVATELVTNAIRHGTLPACFRAELRPRTLYLEVADRGDAVAPPGPDSRGLRIVAALSVSWGVSVGPRGKAVWAEVPLQPAAGR